MDRDAGDELHNLEEYRGFLVYLARIHLDPRLQRTLDADDIVQETIAVALQKMGQFRGQSVGELKAWLRQILLHTLANALEKLHAAKGDVRREQSLDAVVEKSSARLQAILADGQSTPCEKAQRNEQAMLLEAALDGLPPRQREAVVLKHYHSWSLAEISKHMNATQSAVVGLLNRGLLALHDELAEPE